MHRALMVSIFRYMLMGLRPVLCRGRPDRSIPPQFNDPLLRFIHPKQPRVIQFPTAHFIDKFLPLSPAIVERR